VINAVQERRYVPSGFESSRDATAPPTDSDAELPPTKGEVEAAKRHLDSLSMPRPMYRGEAVRINGGRGPTVAQSRADAQSRGEARSEIARARAEYERLNSAWQASDKTQDDDAIRCENCGAWFTQYHGRCPECGP